MILFVCFKTVLMNPFDKQCWMARLQQDTRLLVLTRIHTYIYIHNIYIYIHYLYSILPFLYQLFIHYFAPAALCQWRAASPQERGRCSVRVAAQFQQGARPVR